MKAKELRRTMEQMNETPASLAEMMGVHIATIYRWLSGEARIPVASAKLLERIAKERGVAA